MSWQPGPYGNNPQQPQQPQQPPAQGFPEYQPGGPPPAVPPGPYGPGGPGGPFDYGPPPKRGPNGGLIVAIVVVAVLLIGGLGTGAYLVFVKKDSNVSSGDTDIPSGPTPTDSLAAIPQPVWEAKLPKGWSDTRMTTLLGSWIGDEVVVRGQRDSVVAYSLKDGKAVWQLPADGVGFCGMSSTTREGVGYVSYGALTGDNIACTKLQAIDVATGKQRWDVDVAGGEEYPPEENDGQRPEVFGDVVATRADGGAERTLKAYDAGTGDVRWTFFGTANNPLGDGDCGLEDRMLSKELLLVVGGCAPQARTFGKEQAVVFALDPATGKPRWTTPIPTLLVPEGDANYAFLLGTDYPAIAVRSSKSIDIDAVVGLDPASGKLGTPIRVQDQKLALTANGNPRMMDTVTVSPTISNESTLVVRVKSDEVLRAPEGQYGSCVTPVGLMAFDLKQGKVLWDKPAALSCDMSIVGFDGANVLVIDAGGPGDKGPRLLSVDPGGKATAYKQLGAPRNEDRLGKLVPGPATIKNDVLVLVPEHPSPDRFPFFALGLPMK
jgi:outer membrane protein assembly factor BamB